MPACRDNWRRKRARAKRNAKSHFRAVVKRVKAAIANAWRGIPESDPVILNAPLGVFKTTPNTDVKPLTLEDYQNMMFGLRRAGTK